MDAWQKTEKPVRARLGILGGTFNPLHVGHLVLAQNAMEIFDLSRILFLPSHIPPHKDTAMVVEARHRLAMLEAVLEDEWRFDLCDLELQREGPTYTIDTLHELHKMYPSCSLNFIIGADTLTELHTWKDIYSVLESCNMLTLCRPGSDVERLSPENIKLAEPWPERLLENLASGRLMDISSSDIRHRVAEGLSIRYLVPPPVEMYIAEHHLYGA
ncbi:MAG: nicotinate (nicotinamide) nucleotide adenylyltransferase [Kiritimatiellae bacterium]|nr:nicotinate (nicotinamide) nucleotide adenylyltransferase [Kiritimatiellia bacterium]